MSRPLQRDIDIVNRRYKRTDSIFVHPMLPGYEGAYQTHVTLIERQGGGEGTEGARKGTSRMTLPKVYLA